MHVVLFVCFALQQTTVQGIKIKKAKDYNCVSSKICEGVDVSSLAKPINLYQGSNALYTPVNRCIVRIVV